MMALLEGPFPEEAEFADFAEEAPAAAALAQCLYDQDRLIWLDWAVDLEDCLTGFEPALAALGIKAGDAWMTQLMESAQEAGLSRGDAVGFVYAQLRPKLAAKQMRIMGLNLGGDEYLMFLAPAEAVARWASVQIDPDIWIENPDWQFKGPLKAMGVAPETTKHPSGTPVMPPSAP